MNRQTITARFGGDTELADKLIELFITECPRMLGEIRESVEAGCADRIRRSAHTFKGAVGNFTEGGPTQAAFALEEIGRAGTIGDATTLLAKLEHETADLLAAMQPEA